MSKKGKVLNFSLKEVYEEIGYKFKTPSLLIQALKDSSCTNNKFIDKDDASTAYYATKNNKTLAFYGDLSIYGAIGKIIGENTYTFNKDHIEEYTFLCSLKELTNKKVSLSKNETFKEMVRENDFYSRYVIKGEALNKSKKSEADSFEAVMGAVAIDSNWNYQEIIKVFKKLMPFYKEKVFTERDYYNYLSGIEKETCLERISELVNNKTIRRPIVNELSFEDNLFCFQYEILGIGKATGLWKSKKEAKRDACNNLIKEYLNKNKQDYKV